MCSSIVDVFFLASKRFLVNINVTKSELVRSGDGSDATRLTKVFGCKRVELPIKYLDMHLGANYLDVRM